MKPHYTSYTTLKGSTQSVDDHFWDALYLCVKMSLYAKPFIWKWFQLQVHFHANQTHFHVKDFARGLVLKLRHEVNSEMAYLFRAPFLEERSSSCGRSPGKRQPATASVDFGQCKTDYGLQTADCKVYIVLFPLSTANRKRGYSD